MAIKREMAGLVEFRAYENCFVKNLRGEKIIKTGELYSIKRDGRYKNRFIIFGNLMRKMVDYFYTTSYTLSYDGFRLFAALSSVFGKTIKGSDARCGYLQSAPLMKDPVYIYRPSFAPYFELPIDKIEELRLKLPRPLPLPLPLPALLPAFLTLAGTHHSGAHSCTFPGRLQSFEPDLWL